MSSLTREEPGPRTGWFANPAAGNWQSDPVEGRPRAFHCTLPGYSPTPLTPLPAVADALGVRSVLLKDESARLGLPAFKVLGASYAIARALSARLGDTDALPLDLLRERVGGSGLRLVAATDGNHGRAVAHVAALLGLESTIYVPTGLSSAALDAIAEEGAELIQLEQSYDDVVQHAAQQAGSDALLIQDTSWEGYELVPRWIVDGYATLTQEVDDQLRAAGEGPVSLVVVPAGVGSLAQAVVQHYRSAAHRPAILVCEPDTAASVTTALHAGHVVPVRTGDTVMTGLNCGTVSELAWPALRDGLDASITVTDAQATAAARELATLGVDSGPCGAATLAALRAAASSSSKRDALGLTADSVVVLLSTEGSGANPKIA